MARMAKSIRAEATFRSRLSELGATLLEPEWLGSLKPHRVQCNQGHECSPRPADVGQGHGVCRRCPGLGSNGAADRFRQRIAELGATLLEEEWRGSDAYYQAVCPQGHECTYCPDQLSRGRGGCQTCGKERGAALRMVRAEEAFRARVDGLGATLLEPEYRGSDKPHQVLCRSGHRTTVIPAGVMQGGGVCRTCAGADPAVAEQAFRARLAELGATLLEPRYLGNKAAHRVLCTAGHECTPTPANARKGGICMRCRADSRAAEAAFRARIEELGGTLLEPHWLGATTPHRVECLEGHVSTPRPTGVTEGGICRYCVGKAWDAFYVVANDDERLIKFGITSGSGGQRLRRHRRYGYLTVHRLVTGLAAEVAPSLERDVLGALLLAGEKPAHGREYFREAALALVLDIADNYPIKSLTPAWRQS